MSWHQQSFDPVIQPSGRKLVTLRDAAHYITKPLKAEQLAPEWQAAIEVLMLIGENGGDPMIAYIAMMRALQHKPEAAPAPPWKRAKATGSSDDNPCKTPCAKATAP